MPHLFSAQSTASLLPPPFVEHELDDQLRRHGIAPTEFQAPDFEKSIDVRARIATVPESATVRGVYFESLARRARRFGVDCRGRYTPFRSYSMREYMELLSAYAKMRYPRLAAREALRRIGWDVFPTLIDSIAGKVMFAVAGTDLNLALNLTPNGYRHSIYPGEVRVRLNSSHQVVLEFREIHNFVDCYQVGTMEGGCRAYRKNEHITIRQYSEVDLDMLIRW